MRTYTRYTFDVVSVSATKRWRDPDGKRRQVTRRFEQSINPYNIDAATGQPKTWWKIRTEIQAEREAWLAQEPKA